MQWLFAGFIGVVIGSSVGWAAEHVAIASVVQSVAAFLVALVIGEISIILWWMRRWKSGYAGYWAFGLDNLFYLAILCGLAAVLHVGVGRFGEGSFDALVSHRPIVLGTAGGLWGVVSGARVMHAVMRWSLRHLQ